MNFANSLVRTTGTVKVWDPRQKDDPVANMEPVQGENKRDCWTVAFGKLLKNLAFEVSDGKKAQCFKKFPIVSLQSVLWIILIVY